MRAPTALAIIAALTACSDTPAPELPPEPGAVVPADTLPLAADPPGDWYDGDMHVHATGASNDTGGDSFPADIKARAIERGLFFVVLTDHSNSTGSDVDTRDEDPAKFNQGPEFPFFDLAAQLSEPGRFLLIDGNELSPVAPEDSRQLPTGHIGCVPVDLASFDPSIAFIDRPMGTVTAGEALAQAHAAGCFAILNHPYSASHISYDWTSADYDAIEIWNGTVGIDGGDISARDAWRCDLLAGRDIPPIAASDNHRVNIAAPGGGLDPALGFPATSVFAAAPTWPAIIDGLRAGRVALHEGLSRIELDGYADDGARDESPGTRWIRVRARLDPGADRAQLVVTRATACDDPRPEPFVRPAITEDVVHELSLSGGQSVDLAVRIDGGPGVYTAIMEATGGSFGAMSRAVIIR